LRRIYVSEFWEILPLDRILDVEREFVGRFGRSSHSEQTVMGVFILKDLNEFGRSSDEFIVFGYDKRFEDVEEKSLNNYYKTTKMDNNAKPDGNYTIDRNCCSKFNGL